MSCRGPSSVAWAVATTGVRRSAADGGALVRVMLATSVPTRRRPRGIIGRSAAAPGAGWPGVLAWPGMDDRLLGLL